MVHLSGDREARLPRRDAAGAMAADEVLRPPFETFLRERGKVPNLYRIAAHAPALAATLAEHQRVVMGEGAVDVLLKELLSVRVSQINNCEY